MTAHIFTVDKSTFPVHLKYLFAGTGATDKEEQIGALVDIMATRPGDDVVFYVMDCGFFGFFKIKSSPFYEHPENQYLDDELTKKLTYRVLLEPSPIGVYKKGINEWDAIENPSNILNHSIFNMQWGWIFKKLHANRGCAAIIQPEFELLRNIIVKDNARISGRGFSFVNGQIINGQFLNYAGRTVPPILPSRLITVEEDIRFAFTAAAGENSILDKVLCPQDCGRITTILNEVKCSFGARSMDLVLVSDRNICFLIELKNNFPKTKEDFSISLKQLYGYAQWVAGYKPYFEQIIPILIVREPERVSKRAAGIYFKYAYQTSCFSDWYSEMVQAIKEAAENSTIWCLPKVDKLRVYECEVREQKLTDFCLLS